MKSLKIFLEDYSLIIVAFGLSLMAFVGGNTSLGLTYLMVFSGILSIVYLMKRPREKNGRRYFKASGFLALVFVISLILKLSLSFVTDIKYKDLGYTPATVSKVIDGDTADMVIDGETVRVRFIGIDTPEINHPTKGEEYFGREASDFTRKNLKNKKVYLKKDVSDTDKYDRLLRYVWLEIPNDPANPSYIEIEHKLFNGILVKEGYARSKTYPPDTAYQDELDKLENRAREAGIGMWND